MATLLGFLPGALLRAAGQAVTRDSADFNHKYEGDVVPLPGYQQIGAFSTAPSTIHRDGQLIDTSPNGGNWGGDTLYFGSAGSFYGGPTVHLDYLRWDDTGAYAPGAGPPPPPPPPGPPLLAEWKCDDGSGPVLSDSSGNGKNGAISGATFVPQGSGHALFLDGRDDYVDCGISGAGGIGINGAVSIEAWVNPTRKAFGGAAVLGQDLHTFLWTYSNTEVCNWYIGSGANRVKGQLDLNRWNHVATVFDGARIKIWINGRNTGDQPSQFTTLNPTGPLTLGTALQPQLPRFKGLLDNVRIYDGAITEAEVVAHFQAEAVEHDFDPSSFTHVKIAPYDYLDGEYPNVVVEADYRLLQPLPSGAELTVSLSDSNTPGTVILSRIYDALPSDGVIDVTVPCDGLPTSDYLIRSTLSHSGGAFPDDDYFFSFPPPASSLAAPSVETAGSLPPPPAVTPFGFTMENGGGFTVTINGTDYPFHSRVSWPNGNFNVLQAGVPYAGGEGSWTVSTANPGANQFTANASGSHYSIVREIEVFSTHASIRDRYTNTGGSDLGLLIYNETPVSPGQVTNALQSGHERYWRQVDHPYPDYTPSVFFEDANTGIGMVPLDDVYVVQAVPYIEWEDAAGMGTETFALAPGANYTLEWAVYPTGSGDYYDFVNRVRTVEGRIGTVDKTPGFITGTPHPPTRREIPTRDHIEKRALDIGLMHGLSEIADDPELHIEGVEFIDFPQERALLTTQRDEIRLQSPELQVAFHIATSLYATDDPNRYADSRVIHSNGSQATWSDGSAFGPVKQAAGWRWWIFYPYPSNSFHNAMMDSVDVMMDEMGYDGGFMDGIFAAYAGERTYDTGLRWDGHSAEISLSTRTITRKFSSVLLLSRSSLIEYVRKIRDKGGVVVSNNSVLMPTFLAEDYIIFDNEGASGPELHLAPNATVLSVTTGFDSEREIYLDMLDKLSWGQLFVHFTDGMALTHPSLASKQYPMTFEEVGSGLVRGPERIVTMNQGSYGWPGDTHLHLVHHFDARGAPASHEFITTVDVSANPVRTDLALGVDESAVIEPVPVVLTSGSAVNARVLQYDDRQIHLLLNGLSPASLQVSSGIFPIVNGSLYDVSIGGAESTLAAGPGATLSISSISLSGQVDIVIQPEQVMLTVQSPPVTSVEITGTAAGVTPFNTLTAKNTMVTLTAPAAAADSTLPERFGFIATLGSNGSSSDIFDANGTLVANLAKAGRAYTFDTDGSLYIGQNSLESGKYPVWRYPYTGGATWGAPVKYCEVDFWQSALAVDAESGTLYIGSPNATPWMSNVWKCEGEGQTPTLFCGVNDNSRLIQDLAVGPDGKLWMGLFAWGHLRFPLSGGFEHELRIHNDGKAGGLEFGPDRNGDGKPELYGSVDESIINFGYYDYESGLQLGTLISDPWIQNYSMTFWPDWNGDGVAEICLANYFEAIRLYDGVTGAYLTTLAQGSPIFTISGGVPKTIPFLRWRVDGVAQPFGQRTITILPTSDSTVEAIYAPSPKTYLMLK
jgi:hypothetical protein